MIQMKSAQKNHHNFWGKFSIQMMSFMSFFFLFAQSQFWQSVKMNNKVIHAKLCVICQFEAFFSLQSFWNVFLECYTQIHGSFRELRLSFDSFGITISLSIASTISKNGANFPRNKLLMNI